MINFFRGNNINNDYTYKLTRRSILGVLATSFIIASGVASETAKFIDVGEVNNLNSMFNHDSLSVSVDDINDLNIIINDSDCSDFFFNEICSNLRNDGIIFNLVKDCANINKDNSTIITLDQQYSSGSDTLIFAPFNNSRLGYSDSLAIAMKSAFEQNNFSVANILCGQVGFEQNSDGGVSYIVPTETEKKVGDNDSSFVTISFGTSSIDPVAVANSIKSGLARQSYYLKNCDTQNDLIYNSNSNDSLEMIAKYFDTDSKSLIDFNKLYGKGIPDAFAMINPNVRNINIFSKDISFKINKSERTHHI